MFKKKANKWEWVYHFLKNKNKNNNVSISTLKYLKFIFADDFKQSQKKLFRNKILE